MTKNFKDIIVEIILLAVLVGLIPELFVGAANDAFGACGFSEDICNKIALQSVYKGVGVLVCTIAALVVSLLISKEFNDGGI